MNLGFFLTRRTHLKILSPIIEAAIQRAHPVTLIAEVRAAKRGDTLKLREMRALWPQALITTTLPWWLDALIGPEPVLPRTHRCPVIGVDHFFDSWLSRPRPDVTMCYHSDYHRDTRLALWPSPPVEPARHRVVGWLPADQAPAAHGEVALSHLYRSGALTCEALLKWRVPQQQSKRDSAVFFALKLDVPEPWRRSIEGWAAYKEIAHQAKARAKDEGLRFVVKSRAKNRDPWWLRWMADEYVLDECMVPYTSLSLLARAKWCVHFESGAGLEAALMGCYSIAFGVSQSHISNLPGGNLQYGNVPMHSWPGVAQYGQLVDDTIPPPLDPVERTRYLDHFVGACDGRAGERIVQIAEGL